MFKFWYNRQSNSSSIWKSLCGNLCKFFIEIGIWAKLLSHYTCDKQVLWESAGAFFPRDNSLISRGNSHVSRVRGLVVRCLLFNNSEVRVRTRGYALIFRSRKKFSTTYAIVLFFFLPTFSWKFQISQKLSIRFSRNFAQSFYTQRGPCVCKGIKIVWPGCEKHSQN